MSNRIAKHVWKDETWERSTYYLLDAQGNQVSIYEHNPDAPTVEFNLVENNVYGSSRVGSLHREIDLLTSTYSNHYSSILGNKNYEFSNHLGNVLTVFTDKKIPQDEDNNGKVDGYEIGIFSTADYSPFGVELDGRSMRSEGYRYGFQNQEKDDEIKGEGNSVNYKYRMHDPRVGRFFAVDPLSPEYPWNSPYAFSENVVINAVELEGLEKIDHYVYSPTEKKWVISWQEIDNNLTVNLNAYHYFDKDKKNYKTVVKPWEKNKDGERLRVTFNGNIRNNEEDRDNRQAMYHLFGSTEFAKKSESEKELEANKNNSVSEDATYWSSTEGDKAPY